MSNIVIQALHTLGIGGAGCISGVSQNRDGTSILGKRTINHLPERITSNLKAEVLVLGNLYSAAMAVKDLATGILGIFATVLTGSYAYKKSETIRTWTHNITQVIPDVFQSIPLAGNLYAAWRNNSNTKEAAAQEEKDVARIVNGMPLEEIVRDLPFITDAYKNTDEAEKGQLIEKLMLDKLANLMRDKLANTYLKKIQLKDLEPLASFLQRLIRNNDKYNSLCKKIADAVYSIRLELADDLNGSLPSVKNREEAAALKDTQEYHLDSLTPEELANTIQQLEKELADPTIRKASIEQTQKLLKLAEKYETIFFNLFDEEAAAAQSKAEAAAAQSKAEAAAVQKEEFERLRLKADVDAMTLDLIVSYLPIIADTYKKDQAEIGMLLENLMLDKLNDSSLSEQIKALKTIEKGSEAQVLTKIKEIALCKNNPSKYSRVYFSIKKVLETNAAEAATLDVQKEHMGSLTQEELANTIQQLEKELADPTIRKASIEQTQKLLKLAEETAAAKSQAEAAVQQEEEDAMGRQNTFNAYSLIKDIENNEYNEKLQSLANASNTANKAYFDHLATERPAQGWFSDTGRKTWDKQKGILLTSLNQSVDKFVKYLSDKDLEKLGEKCDNEGFCTLNEWPEIHRNVLKKEAERRLSEQLGKAPAAHKMYPVKAGYRRDKDSGLEVLLTVDEEDDVTQNS